MRRSNPLPVPPMRMKRQRAFLHAGTERATIAELFHAAPVGCALLDRNLRIVALNAAMRALLGEAGAGAALASFHTGAALVPLCLRVIEAGEVISQPVFTEQRRYYALVYPVNAPAISGIGAIITEVKPSGSCPMDAQKSESITRLAAGIAHHFNNLLTGIMGGASLALERLPFGHPARSAVEIIADSSKRAAELTHHLLAYSGGAPPRCAPVDLERAIRRACDEMRRTLPSRVALRLEAERGLPQISMDELGFQEALDALLRNAAEAIGDRQGAICVSARYAEFTEPLTASDCMLGELRPGSYVQLDVSDDGCGMNAETKAKMFEPFFSTKLFGRGLGLAAVQNLVRTNQGCVRVDTEPGRGTVVSLLLKPAAGLAGSGGPVPG
jgi:signal transduction histidine kinase